MESCGRGEEAVLRLSIQPVAIAIQQGLFGEWLLRHLEHVVEQAHFSRLGSEAALEQPLLAERLAEQKQLHLQHAVEEGQKARLRSQSHPALTSVMPGRLTTWYTTFFFSTVQSR